MYITQTFKVLHNSWRYILGILIIFILWQVIGSMPLLSGIAYDLGLEGLKNGDFPTSVSEMSDILGSNLFLFLMLLSFGFGLIGVFFVAKVIHKESIRKLTTGRPKVDWKRIGFAFLLWGIISVGMTLIGIVLSPEDFEWNFQLKPFLILAAIAIIMIPIQTSFEEYLFRGYLLQGLGVLSKTKWVPLFVTSLIFGLMHIANPEVDKLGPIIMVYYIGTGLFLGIITLMDDGLELALGFHAANNLFTALLVTADWTAFQTHSIYKDMSDPSTMGVSAIIVPVFVIFPILLFVFYKKYNWTNWKDKLFGSIKEPLTEDYKILE